MENEKSHSSKPGISPRHIVAIGLATCLGILAFAALSPVATAQAAARVDRYEPTMASPDDVVTIHGGGWGARKPGHSIGYGTGSAMMGTAAITTWADRSIRAHLPRRMPDGLYWLAIYENDNLKSNQLRELRIGKMSGKGPGPGKGDGPGITPGPFGRDKVREGDLERGRRPSGTPGLNDLAIVGIDPPVGAEVNPRDHRLPVRVSVRNNGGRTQRFVVSATGATTPLVSSAPTDVGPGRTVAVPLEIGAPPNLITDGELRTTVALGTPESPAAFRDANRGNNTLAVRYPLSQGTFAVTATLEHIDVRDDCDNLTEGDWLFHFSLFSVRVEGDRRTQVDQQYGTFRRDVDSGRGYDFTETRRLTGVPGDHAIQLYLNPLDCDMDGVFSIPLVFEGGWGPVTWAVTCGGEEITELSGENDYVGTANANLTPAQWQRGGTFEATGSRRDCGSRPYTARFRVRATRE